MKTVGPVFRACPEVTGEGMTVAWTGQARSRTGPIPGEVGSTATGGVWVAVSLNGQRRCAIVANVGGAAAVLKSPQLMESLANKWAFQQA